jgi:hypothetical protein
MNTRYAYARSVASNRSSRWSPMPAKCRSSLRSMRGTANRPESRMTRSSRTLCSRSRDHQSLGWRKSWRPAIPGSRDRMRSGVVPSLRDEPAASRKARTPRTSPLPETVPLARQPQLIGRSATGRRQTRSAAAGRSAPRGLPGSDGGGREPAWRGSTPREARAGPARATRSGADRRTGWPGELSSEVVAEREKRRMVLPRFDGHLG